jgi:hypothetical protein
MTADDGSGHTGLSNGFTVSAGALHHFVIAYIPAQTAGTAFNLMLTAQDVNNNTVTSFTGTVSISTTAGAISPITSASFTSGMRTESVTVTQAGTGKTISVNDGAGHTGLSNAFNVSSGVLHHFALAMINSPQTAGTAFSLTLTAQDANNNIVSGFAGTVNLSTTAGTISPATSGAFASGVRMENVAVTQAGTGKTITADDGSSHTGTSNGFTVNSDALHHIAIGNIGTQTAGTAFNVMLTAQDANNNTVTSFTGTVGLTTNAGTISPTTAVVYLGMRCRGGGGRGLGRSGGEGERRCRMSAGYVQGGGREVWRREGGGGQEGGPEGVGDGAGLRVVWLRSLFGSP